jgi:hypothetical protein
MPPQVSEASLAQACTQLLELDGWRALKTDPVSDKSRGKGFGERGKADYLYIRYEMRNWSEEDRSIACRRLAGERTIAQVMWIEWKTPTGRVAPHQHSWRERERKRGALALIAGIDFQASIEGFCRWYSESGLQRRTLLVSGKKLEGMVAKKA